MKLIYAPTHKYHQPQYEIFNGLPEAHAEVPERLENIRAALETHLGLKTFEPQKFPLRHISEVHDSDYVRYLLKSQVSKTEHYEYPSIFRYTHYRQKMVNVVALRGLFSFDLYTPVNNTTFGAAKQSAFCALTAAHMIQDEEQFIYALCRPPGHHAEKSRMGGYCYFNNAAIAAHFLSKKGKVVVLDVDFHHGNGTQHIFYERVDVLTISIHASPKVKFPFFSGFENEIGEKSGKGFNKNFPLPLGTTNTQFHQVLKQAARLVDAYKPQYLVVPVGFDTHKDDPIGGFALTTDYYFQMARTIKRLNLPTLIVQEGGYNTKLLGLNAVSFVRGFLT